MKKALKRSSIRLLGYTTDTVAAVLVAAVVRRTDIRATEAQVERVDRIERRTRPVVAEGALIAGRTDVAVAGEDEGRSIASAHLGGSVIVVV